MRLIAVFQFGLKGFFAVEKRVIIGEKSFHKGRIVVLFPCRTGVENGDC